MKIKVLKNGDVVLSPEGREKNFEKALRKKAEWVSKKPVVIPYHDHYEYVYCVKIAGVDGLVIFITNTENAEVKKIANEPEFKTKLIYILADADFNVE